MINIQCKYRHNKIIIQLQIWLEIVLFYELEKIKRTNKKSRYISFYFSDYYIEI